MEKGVLLNDSKLRFSLVSFSFSVLVDFCLPEIYIHGHHNIASPFSWGGGRVGVSLENNSALGFQSLRISFWTQYMFVLRVYTVISCSILVVCSVIGHLL